ncbi:acyltransferase PGAP2 isoform X10 [Callithrix jacchus]|uniref:post-GPI attachment to proteins factor 2 isoform X10 n=1 Tax=Callithrix jacchus TaxID=9483 RepID=UPI00159E94E0|nr:post-GPI attachment to proteins factor 2 isoform X10 [Callithrix jacchus]
MARLGSTGGMWGRVVTQNRDSAPCLGALRLRLRELGPMRGTAPEWHGNYSTLYLPRSAGAAGKAFSSLCPHFLDRPRAEFEDPSGRPLLQPCHVLGVFLGPSPEQKPNITRVKGDGTQLRGLTRCTRSHCHWTGMGPWYGSASPWWPWSRSAVHLSPSSSASSGPCSSTSRRQRPHTVGHPRKCFHCVHRLIPRAHAPHLHSLAADQEAHSKSGGSQVLQLETAALHHQLRLFLLGAGCLPSAQHVL